MATPYINIASIVRKAEEAMRNGKKESEIRTILQVKGEKGAALVAKELQKEFEDNKVTQEFRRGANESSFTGYGNLAAFLGLSPVKLGTDLAAMKELLSFYFVKVTRKKGTTDFEVKVNFSPEKNFYNITEPPDNTYPMSWLKALEQGLLANFNKFIFEKGGVSGSRSGTGVQIQGTIKNRAQTLPKIPYIKAVYDAVLNDVGRARSILGNAVRKKI